MKEFGRLRFKIAETILAGAGLATAACGLDGSSGNGESIGGGGDKSPNKTESLNRSNESDLPWVDSEPWYLTGGPHYDGLSHGVKYAIDFAPPDAGHCPESAPLINRYVTASSRGKVIVTGDEKNQNDPNHSVVEIQRDDGTIDGYMHLANIRVANGQEINKGVALGNPSCEKPPGGKTDGQHVHEYRKDKNGNPISVKDLVLSGWKFEEDSVNYNGIAAKTGEAVRTADIRHCGPSQESINACGGIRNDLAGSGYSPKGFSIPTPATTPTVPVPTPLATEKPKSESKYARVGEPAPDFAIKNLDGKIVRLSDFKGKPVAIILWQDWAFGVSDSAVDQIVNINNGISSSGLVVLVDVNVNTVRTKNLKAKVTDVLLDGNSASLMEKYSATAVPMVYLVDKKGVLAAQRAGRNPSDTAMKRDLEDLVAGRPLFKSGSIDYSLIKIPLPPENNGTWSFATQVYLPKDQAQTFTGFVNKALDLSSKNEEGNILAIVQNLQQAGKIVANGYCASPGQQIYENLRFMAKYSLEKAAKYIGLGLLDASVWPDLVKSFNPPCELKHFPTK